MIWDPVAPVKKKWKPTICTRFPNTTPPIQRVFIAKLQVLSVFHPTFFLVACDSQLGKPATRRDVNGHQIHV